MNTETTERIGPPPQADEPPTTLVDPKDDHEFEAARRYVERIKRDRARQLSEPRRKPARSNKTGTTSQPESRRQCDE